MTRLLKTPIIGPWPAIVTSSWIDIEAGLSKKYILRTPPRFLRQRRIASHRKQQPGDEEDVMSRPHVHFLPPNKAAGLAAGTLIMPGSPHTRDLFTVDVYGCQSHPTLDEEDWLSLSRLSRQGDGPAAVAHKVACRRPTLALS